jgi:hypothetical protein
MMTSHGESSRVSGVGIRGQAQANSVTIRSVEKDDILQCDEITGHIEHCC